VAVFYEVGFVFEDDILRAVTEAVENRCGGGDVIVKDRGPMFVGLFW